MTDTQRPITAQALKSVGDRLNDWGDQLQEMQRDVRQRRDQAERDLDDRLVALEQKRLDLASRLEKAKDRLTRGAGEVRDDLVHAAKTFADEAQLVRDALKKK